MTSFLKNKILWVAAFGYFVDLYDLVLYGVVRMKSLRELQVPESEIFSVGASLLNFQMGGMLLGGLAWGILGDKKGRRAALFGSIFLYSIATFMNAFVQNVPQYAFLRFVAGFGLAGELGAAITMVSEALPQKTRGLGATVVASVGFIGAALSSYLAQHLSWQHAYMSGGILGFCLLLSRINISESTLFLETKAANHHARWGSVIHLFTSRDRLVKLFLILIVGVPIWYVAGILSYFSPEFAKLFQIQGTVTAGTTIMMGYLGAILGDISCGILSYKLQSRKKAIMCFLLFGASVALGHSFFIENASSTVFYWVMFAVGFGNGYVAVLIAWVAELFGTNLRATAATLVPNLIRAAVIPLTLSLKALEPSCGLINASRLIGTVCFTLAIISMFGLAETYHRNLRFEES